MTLSAPARDGKIDGAVPRTRRARGREGQLAVALARLARTIFQIRVAIAAPRPRDPSQLGRPSGNTAIFLVVGVGTGDQRAGPHASATARSTATVVSKPRMSYVTPSRSPGRREPVAPRDDDVFDSTVFDSSPDDFDAPPPRKIPPPPRVDTTA